MNDWNVEDKDVGGKEPDHCLSETSVEPGLTQRPTEDSPSALEQENCVL
jgi:hypothetical protein